MKKCSHCHQIKPLSDFHRNRYYSDGHAHRCKDCSNDYQRKEYASKRQPAPPADIPEGTKRCNHCRQLKSLDDFPRDRSYRDGHSYTCKVCKNARYREQRANGSRQASAAKYRKNPQVKEAEKRRLAAYHASHPERLRANKAVNNAIQAGKLNRPPVSIAVRRTVTSKRTTPTTPNRSKWYGHADGVTVWRIAN